MAVFAGGLAAAGAMARLFRWDPQCHTALDFLVLAAASFKAARTLSHDDVTSFIRDPFVQGKAHSGDEEPVGGGLEQAIGELDADPRGALRAAPHVVARRCRGERLRTGGLRGADF